MELSPASIRNVMADLEEMGYIASPHTSAGRIPTPKGYRLFVDTLLTIQPLERMEREQLEHSIRPDDPRHVVAAASQLLSDLTHFAGLVMTPRRRGVGLTVLLEKIVGDAAASASSMSSSCIFRKNACC
jgi:heat-inducible transcriptional repressor